MIEMMELFHVDITQMTNDFRNYVIIVGVVMAGIAVIELILGFMATGNTRYALWARVTENTDCSTGPLARPFARSPAPLTRGKVNY